MRILVVEDEQDLNRILAKTLTAEGYSVDACFDGVEALDYLEGAEYDAIVLDVMMPRMDGFSLLAQMRESGNETPVIFLTAKDSVPDRVRGLDAGADDYLTKPFGVMEFVSRIRALLRRFSSKKKQISVIGNRQKIELNKDAREVFVKGEKCPLTYKEFELLQVLMSHADQVMTRDSLMELIWGVDFFGESRTLDMHIRTLRKKLGEAGSQIQTIRNVGYCFRKTEDETE